MLDYSQSWSEYIILELRWYDFTLKKESLNFSFNFVEIQVKNYTCTYVKIKGEYHTVKKQFRFLWKDINMYIITYLLLQTFIIFIFLSIYV